MPTKDFCRSVRLSVCLSRYAPPHIRQLDGSCLIQRSMLAISEHRARCRTNRASEFLLAARLLGSRARSAYQPGGCCSAWVLDYNCFFPKSEKFVWVLKKCIGTYHFPPLMWALLVTRDTARHFYRLACSVRLLARQLPQQVCSVRLLAR